jgi:hypothetical protein
VWVTWASVYLSDQRQVIVRGQGCSPDNGSRCGGTSFTTIAIRGFNLPFESFGAGAYTVYA